MIKLECIKKSIFAWTLIYFAHIELLILYDTTGRHMPQILWNSRLRSCLAGFARQQKVRFFD